MSKLSNRSSTGPPDEFRTSAHRNSVEPITEAKLEKRYLKGFITYSHEDAKAKDELRKHLAVMKHQNELTTWEDSQLIPGDPARQEDILKEVADSDLLLYLVSAESLASENCKKEFEEALERDIIIISIILEYCDWLGHQLSDFEVLPHKGKPLSQWDDRNKGWRDVVVGIRKAVDKIQAQKNPSPEISEEYRRAQEFFQNGNIFLAELRRKGAPEKAIEAYSQAIEIYPSHAKAYRHRGEVYRSQRDFEKALADYNKAIEIDPKFAEAYNNRGIVYGEQGDLEQARVEFDTALELDPKLDAAYNNRGEVYRKMEKFNEALKDYDKAIELAPDDPESYRVRGVIYRRMDKLGKAIENYDKAIELDRFYASPYSTGVTFTAKWVSMKNL